MCVCVCIIFWPPSHISENWHIRDYIRTLERACSTSNICLLSFDRYRQIGAHNNMDQRLLRLLSERDANPLPLVLLFLVFSEWLLSLDRQHTSTAQICQCVCVLRVGPNFINSSQRDREEGAEWRCLRPRLEYYLFIHCLVASSHLTILSMCVCVYVIVRPIAWYTNQFRFIQSQPYYLPRKTYK